jgi:hypothetical protein
MKIKRPLFVATMLASMGIQAQPGSQILPGESAGIPNRLPTGTTDVVCSYAPSQNPVVNRITAGLGGVGTGAAAILQAAGLTAVTHSSGAYILTGAGGYVAGTIGAAIVAPVLITASVVVAGTAVTLELTCAPKNHPEAVKKVRQITDEFNKSVRSVNGKAIDLRDGAMKSINELNDRAIDTRNATAKNIWDANERAIEFRDSTARRIAAGWF